VRGVGSVYGVGVVRVDSVRADLHRGLRRVLAPGALTQIRWMLEELRVSYFAQALGTPYPVSEKRLLRAIDQVTA
jgi:ATP-dependent helicase HrpA